MKLLNLVTACVVAAAFAGCASNTLQGPDAAPAVSTSDAQQQGDGQGEVNQGDASQGDASQPDANQQDANQQDASQPDASQPDANQQDANQTDGNQADADQEVHGG
jgi:hypothetical protein